jgi:hypothetical protein
MDFIILTLATWRISNLFVNEDGPFMVFAELRRMAGVTYDFEGEPIASNEAAKLLTCVFCFSIWLGLAVAVAYYFYPVRTYWVCLPFALSAGAVALDRWVNQ